jgi:hypothetical protein
MNQVIAVAGLLLFFLVMCGMFINIVLGAIDIIIDIFYAITGGKRNKKNGDAGNNRTAQQLKDTPYPQQDAVARDRKLGALQMEYRTGASSDNILAARKADDFAARQRKQYQDEQKALKRQQYRNIP